MSRKPPLKTILLCAGGTGGHLFPAIALAERLKEEGWSVFLMTDVRGHAYVPQRLFESIFVIPSGQLKGSFSRKWHGLRAIFSAFGKAFLILRRLRPQILWGFGGAASFMPLVWGFIYRIPLGLYQADAILGRANRRLLPMSRKIATGFQKTWGLFPNRKTTWVGFPVRESIVAAPYVPPTPGDRFRLLVIGGSQGAKIFSDIIPQAVGLLEPALQDRLEIVQQCRPDLLEFTQNAYALTGAHVYLFPFIQSMGEALANAHLVVSRAGASTIGELSRVGRPALFVPYPYATQNHQVENARYVLEAGGGWVMQEGAFTPVALAEYFQALLKDPTSLVGVAAQIQTVNHQNSVGALSEVVQEVLSLSVTS